MFVFLFSFGLAVARKIRQCLSARAVIAMVLLLCLLMASCDVRPFSDFGNDDSTEDTIDDMTDDQDNDDDDDVPDAPAELDLDLSASSIAVAVGFEAITQVVVGQRDPNGTYQFAITTPPSVGAAAINSATGRLTFSSQTATDSDSLVVTVTETINNVETGSDTIEISIMVVAP